MNRLMHRSKCPGFRRLRRPTRSVLALVFVKARLVRNSHRTIQVHQGCRGRCLQFRDQSRSAGASLACTANRGRAYIFYMRRGLQCHPAPLQNAGRNIAHRPGGRHRRATAFGCWHIQSRLEQQQPRSSTISPQQRGASSQILHLSISAYRCLLRSMNALVQKSPITNWK
jgi:hypothetical protein